MIGPGDKVVCVEANLACSECGTNLSSPSCPCGGPFCIGDPVVGRYYTARVVGEGYCGRCKTGVPSLDLEELHDGRHCWPIEMFRKVDSLDVDIFSLAEASRPKELIDA